MDLIKELMEFRKSEDTLKWEGTFTDYFKMACENPKLEDLAHARIFNMIMSKGVETRVDGTKRYKFFDEEIFGIDLAMEKLVEEYFHPAAKRLDVRKRVLLLMGPVSGGKSTIVTRLKKGLEEYSRTKEGALYAIKDCPMHESPMHLIPEVLRPAIYEKYGIYIEGDLCPHCQQVLELEYQGKAENVPVERVALSEKKRVGIGTFTPSDPKSQDIADLTGSIDFANILEYGSESDARAYRFDGELNIANRGLMEFQEMLKCDEKFLWNLLSLSQEGNFKAGRFALISADEVVIAHTNEQEYKAFLANKKNEALHSRIIVMRIPYNLRVDDEVRIYDKLINQSDMTHVHIAPYALKTAAIFSVLSRLTQPKKEGVSLISKMNLYNGKESDFLKLSDLRELMLEGADQGEGMQGVDPRYVINRLASALIKDGSKCINPIDVLRALKDGLDTHASISKEQREQYNAFIHAARKEYDEVAKTEVQKAFVYSYEESAKSVFKNYLDNVQAFCTDQKLEDPITGEPMNPDEKLMRSIEEQIGISENAKTAFRQEILIKMGVYAARGMEFDYNTHDRLREAIQKKLFGDLKDVVKITTSSKNPDENQLKRINEVTKTLIENHGYCANCANEMIRYVGSLLNR